MIKKTLVSAVAAVLAFGALAADPYKVMIPMGDDEDGAMAYLVNYDTGVKIDSVLVADGGASFKGEIDEPFVVRVIVDGKRYAQFILESGSIAFDRDKRMAFGSPMNDALRSVETEAYALRAAYEKAGTPEMRDSIVQRYDKVMDGHFEKNIDNPIGYMLFLEKAYDMEPAELEACLAEHPALAKYQRVGKLVEMNRRKAATGEGSKFADFDIRGEKLSDYVGKDGKYLLVDFWASWCGPCRRQLPVIKEIQAKYKAKLNVLGVAVWDEPDDTRRAIKEHELTWPCIIDAGSVPTDVYGISGIPCIMLIAPDGTIVSRDKQNDELRAAVAKAIGE